MSYIPNDRKKLLFNKEIRLMMYGYGDVDSPRQDTAETLENYLVDYIRQLLIKTQNMAMIKGKVKTEDLLYCIKRDRKKYQRIKDLLLTNEELKNARRAFDYEEYEKDE
ncbi:Transcription initiation factor TFIID subunit 13 [Astathelohania contejeani]|uniref:Transcription initiation factor TFIID subunit 13 n=1 Tax=Astathelohania contejeani TaxID=164912 RepID=A0ABQ7HXJ6_9MICR|nr:Transcription initiation factor TFIID subunit 13 [Thelohania contejeani]